MGLRAKVRNNLNVCQNSDAGFRKMVGEGTKNSGFGNVPKNIKKRQGSDKKEHEIIYKKCVHKLFCQRSVILLP